MISELLDVWEFSSAGLNVKLYYQEVIVLVVVTIVVRSWISHSRLVLRRTVY